MSGKALSPIIRYVRELRVMNQTENENDMIKRKILRRILGLVSDINGLKIRCTCEIGYNPYKKPESRKRPNTRTRRNAKKEIKRRRKVGGKV